MRNFIYLILFFIPLLTFGQEKEKTENEKTFFKGEGQVFKGYVAAGINFSQIDGDRMAGFSNIGANAGGGVFVMYSKKISNSLEISYSMRGTKSRIAPKKNSKFSWYQMDYIEIPLLFNYHDFKIAIFQLGLSYNQLIRSKFIYEGAIVDIKDEDIYKWNIDMVVGVTFLIKKHWGINFKYNYSMLNNLVRYDINGNKLKRGTVTTQTPKISNSKGGDLNWYHSVITFRAMYVF